MNTRLKSIVAVGAGFVTSTILSMGTDTIFENTGIFPTIAEQQKVGFDILWMNILALIYRIAFTVVGGYVTSKLAPDNVLRHASILGVIATVIAIIGNVAVAMIPATANVLPLWFSIVLVIIPYPFTRLGGKLYASKSKKLS